MKTFKQEAVQKRAERHAIMFWMLVSFAAYGACLYQVMSGKVIG